MTKEKKSKTDKKKNPVGRPKKNLKDLPKDWKKKSLALAAEGAADIEIRVNAMGHISNDLWCRFMEEELEFSETVQICREIAEQWWVKQGRIALREKEFNYNGYKMQMQNRYKGWQDRVVVGGDKENPLAVDATVRITKADKEDIVRMAEELKNSEEL